MQLPQWQCQQAEAGAYRCHALRVVFMRDYASCVAGAWLPRCICLLSLAGEEGGTALNIYGWVGTGSGGGKHGALIVCAVVGAIIVGVAEGGRLAIVAEVPCVGVSSSALFHVAPA